MTHTEVMFNGYGRDIQPEHFPIVSRFLKGEMNVIDGEYSLNNFIAKGLAEKRRDQFIKSNFYMPSLTIPITSGMISSGDAAYIHGSIGFALMDSTTFTKNGNIYKVNAEVGALDDNWNL